MDTKDVLKNIRVKNKLTQDEMAERLSVTRQAVGMVNDHVTGCFLYNNIK